MLSSCLDAVARMMAHAHERQACEIQWRPAWTRGYESAWAQNLGQTQIGVRYKKSEKSGVPDIASLKQIGSLRNRARRAKHRLPFLLPHDRYRRCTGQKSSG